jgi:hypothetical protein
MSIKRSVVFDAKTDTEAEESSSIETMAAFATGSFEGALRVEVIGGCGSVGEVPQTVKLVQLRGRIAVMLSESAPPFAKAPGGRPQAELASEKLRCVPPTIEGAPNGVPLLIRVSTMRHGVTGT